MSKKLDNMSVSDLWKRFKEATGKETKSPNKKFLITQITEAEKAKREQPRSDRRDQIAASTRGRTGAADSATEAPRTHPTASERDQGDGDAVAAALTDTAMAAEPEENGANLASSPPTQGGLSVADLPDDLDAEAELEIAAEAEANLDDADDDQQDDDEPDDGDAPLGAPPRADLRGKTVEELRAIYVEKVGRETDSIDAAYLKWKIREAEKGRVTVGPVQRGIGAPRTGRRFDEVSTADLEKLFEEKARRKPAGIDRDALIAGILSAERAAAKAARRFADVTVGSLQQRYQQLTGKATDSLARDELIAAIVEAEKSSAPEKTARDPNKPRVSVPVGMYKDALERLDKAWAKHGYQKRIRFMNEALREKLLRLGEADVADLFTP